MISGLILSSLEQLYILL